MNILFYFENVINPTLGGTERATENLAKSLSSKGNCIYYCAKRYSEFETTFPTVILPCGDDVVSQDNILFIEDFVRQNKIDVIFNQGGNTSDVLLFNHYALHIECKIVTCLHFCPYQGYGKYCYSDVHVTGIISLLKSLKLPINKRRNMRLFASNYRKALEYCDAFVVLSDTFVDEVCEIVDTDQYRAKIKVIPNINSFSSYRKKLDKKQDVLYVGRLSYSPKRVDRLLDAWKIVEARCPCAHLNILGDGDDRTYYERYKNKLGLKNVSFYGFQSPIDFYEKSKIITLTSTHESFGMTLIEGMAYQCVPIVYGSYSAAKDIVTDGYNGRLIRPFKTKDFANAIINILEDDFMYERLVSSGFQSINKFKKESVIPMWEKLISEI
ncbi:MAG: glycosyltransferase [Bacteroides sp.]|nr:glycosyltransferase [Bacteroides sp.]